MCVGFWARLGSRYISSLHNADESQEGLNSCPLLLSYSSDLVMLVSRNVSLVVSALYSSVCLYICLAGQISLADPRVILGWQHLLE